MDYVIRTTRKTPPMRPMSVDVKKQALVERMTLATQLTIEKTLAHMDEPAHYPLPADPKSPERALIAHLEKIPADRREHHVNQLLPVFRNQRRSLAMGDLACLDFGSPQSALAQAMAMPVPAQMTFTAEDMRALIPQTKPRADESTGKLELKLRDLRYVKNGSRIGVLAGEDEFAVSGVKSNDSDGTKEVAHIEIGKLNVSESPVFNPLLTFAPFDLPTALPFPREFTTTVTMVEKNAGRGSADLDRIFAGVTAACVIIGTAFVAQAAGDGVIPAADATIFSAGEIASLLVIGLVQMVIPGLLGLVMFLFRDELFPSQTVTIRFDATNGQLPGGEMQGPDQSERFDAFNGNFELTYCWALAS
jgi:hypothetical protein